MIQNEVPAWWVEDFPINNNSRIHFNPARVLAVAVALHLVFFAVSLRWPPKIVSDSAIGFQTWYSWMSGAPWNHCFTPDPNNIARETSYFQSWWSPGQYIICAPWQWIGLTLGESISVGCLAVSLAGLAGYWRLYRNFGFDGSTAAWSVLAAACNWGFTQSYGDYSGGDTALLCAFPWLIIGIHRALELKWGSWPAFAAIYWTGMMIKLTFAIFAVGIVFGLKGRFLFSKSRSGVARAACAARMIGLVIVGQGLVWLSFLRHGPNPSAGGGWIFSVSAIAQLAGFPASSVFSLGTLTGRILLYPGHALVASPDDLWPLQSIIGIAGLVFLAWIGWHLWHRNRDYAWLVLGTWASGTVFFLFFWFRHSEVSFEDRHWRVLGFLLLPAVVSAIRSEKRRFLARGVAGLLVAASLYGVAAVANRARYLALLDNVGRLGFSQQVISKEALAMLHRMDDTLPANSVVLVASPEMALELRRVRALSTHAVIESLDSLKTAEYHGRCPELVILVNDDMIAKGRAAAVLAEFKDYDLEAWKSERIGSWVFYRQ